MTKTRQPSPTNESLDESDIEEVIPIAYNSIKVDEIQANNPESSRGVQSESAAPTKISVSTTLSSSKAPEPPLHTEQTAFVGEIGDVRSEDIMSAKGKAAVPR